MPKFAARSRRSVATVMSTTVIGASLAVLLLPVAAPSAGAAAAPGSTQRASLASPNNTASETGGQDSMLTGDGQSVAFTSQSKLDPSLGTGSGSSAPNYRNVFVRDLRDPAKPKTVMVSRGRFPRSSGGTGTVGVNYGPKKLLELQPGGGGGQDGIPIRDVEPNGNSYSPSISADGRFVAFTTFMTNLFVEDSDSDAEIVVVDRDPDNDGVYDEDGPGSNGNLRTYKYYRITGSDGFQYARLPKLAANASRIVWEQGEGRSELRSKSLNLRADPAVIGAEELVAVPALLNRRVGEHGDPAISGDGNQIVSHVQYVPNCDGCPIQGFHSIVRTDMRTRTSIEVSIDNGRAISANHNEVVQHPAVNNDGSVIAFAAELFEDAIEGPPFSAFFEPTTYVVQVKDNKVTRTDIVSRDNNFTIINGDRPGLSNDGRYIAFVTNNLKAHDGTDSRPTNGDCIEPPQNTVRNSGEPLLRLNALPPRRNAPHTTCQVVVRDLVVDLDRRIKEQSRLPGTLVSPNQAGNPGNGNTVPNIGRDPFGPLSTAPSLSENGGRVAYDSNATDLVSQPADNNQLPDVFVRTMEPGLSGQTVDFKEVEINTSSSKTAVLTETGSGPLVVEQLSIIGANAGDFTVGAQTCIGNTIHATGSCEVSVKFAPTVIGDRKAQLLVAIRGGRSRPTVVDLIGSGKEQPIPPKDPDFSAAPDTLAFGTRLLLSTSPESVVTISNKGELPLQITGIDVVGAPAADYKITRNTCGASVARDAQCTVAVTFQPKASGNRNAVLRFAHNAPGGVNLIGLTGAANQPTIQVNPGVTPPGRVVAVIGKDFPPNMVVTVKFDGRVGETTIRPANDGTFRAQLLIFPKASPETRTVLATMPEFTDPLARTPLLIVYPTVSPANFVVRG